MKIEELITELMKLPKETELFAIDNDSGFYAEVVGIKVINNKPHIEVETWKHL